MAQWLSVVLVESSPSASQTSPTTIGAEQLAYVVPYSTGHSLPASGARQTPPALLLAQDEQSMRSSPISPLVESSPSASQKSPTTIGAEQFAYVRGTTGHSLPASGTMQTPPALLLAQDEQSMRSSPLPISPLPWSRSELAPGDGAGMRCRSARSTLASASSKTMMASSALGKPS